MQECHVQTGSMLYYYFIGLHGLGSTNIYIIVFFMFMGSIISDSFHLSLLQRLGVRNHILAYIADLFLFIVRNIKDGV